MDFREAASILGDPLEPSEGERHNGWDRESLTIYHAERFVAASDRILHSSPAKPASTKNRMKWLRGGLSRA